MSSNDVPVLLRPAEAARILNVATRTLRNWTRSGRVPHVRIGRLIFYPQAALAQWLAAQVRGGTTSEAG